MTEAKILHDRAMDFMDEAMMFSMEGNKTASSNFFKKAFFLEREAIEHAQKENFDQSVVSTYKRSAVALALKSGLFYEAVLMIKSTLADNPSPHIIEQIKELTKELKKQYDLNGLLKVKGKLKFAGFENNEIIIEDKKLQSYNISVTEHQLDEIFKKYKKTEVTIEATLSPSGIFVLKNIKKAA